MKNSKGITLVALTITVIILLILASVTTYSGISTIQSSKLNKYKQELEIMQSEVNLLNEKYSTEIEAGQEIEIGEELTNSEQENTAFTGADETDKTGYRVFTKQTLEELGIDGIDRGEVTFLIQTNIVDEGLEVTIADIKYSKYVGKGNILYQKVGDSTWKTLVTDYREDTYTFILSEAGKYNVKIIDAAEVEKIGDTPIEVPERGNYLLDNTTYFNTLVEAVAAASDGSTIKVLKDTEETESVTIDKSITLDTNGKTINYTDGNTITVNETKNVTIEGNGTINGQTGASFIFNYGNLETNNVTINSSSSDFSWAGAIANSRKFYF